MKNSITRFIGIVETVNLNLGKGVSYLLLAMMFVMSYEVVMRYVFNAPTVWAQETSQFLLYTVTAIGGAYTLLRGGHVNVDIIYSKLSKRTQAILDCITFLLFVFFVGALLWQGWGDMLDSLRIRQRSESFWGAPVYIVKIVLPIGAFLILLQGICKFIRDLATAVTGRSVFAGTPEAK